MVKGLFPSSKVLQYGRRVLNQPYSERNELEKHEKPHPHCLQDAVISARRCTREQGHYHYREVIQSTGILGCLIFDPGQG